MYGVEATFEEKVLMILVRNCFIRQNPALGFCRPTPFRRWVAKILLDILELCPSYSVPYLIRFCIYNQGNLKRFVLFPEHEAPNQAEYEERVIQILQRHFSLARGSGNRYWPDKGGWIWSFVNLLDKDLILSRRELDERFHEALKACLCVIAMETELPPPSSHPIVSIVRTVLKLFLAESEQSEQTEQVTACSPEQS